MRAADVGDLLDGFYLDGGMYPLPAASFPGGAGVPREMQLGDPDPEGWVEWKLLPGVLNAEDRARLEADTGPLPDAFWGYLSARCHLFDEAADRSGVRLLLPSVPCDAPLRDFYSLFNQFACLRGAGYIAFGSWDASIGPLCLDAGRVRADGEMPVVGFDGHRLPDDVHRGIPVSRGVLVPLAKDLHPAFEALLRDVFRGQHG